MAVVIRGLGTAVPVHAITQHDAADHAASACAVGTRQQQVVTRLYARSGVSTRRSVLLTSSTNGDPAEQAFFPPAGETAPLGPTTSERMDVYRRDAPRLAADAAVAALADAAVESNELTHLVTVSCSGFDAPGVDVRLIEALGLPPTVERTHVGYMGCHGALNALRVAHAFARADAHAQVLVVAVELCSLHFQYQWNPQRIVANSLFADGAAALVVADGATQGAGEAPWCVKDHFSAIFPNSTDAMSWKIGDHGFEMSLSPAVPDLIREGLRSRIASWLARHELSVEDVANWAIHPGGPRILDASRDALGLACNALEPSHAILQTYGNMSSPTILFVLDELRRRGATAGATVGLGFGPGLALEAVLLVPQGS